MKEIPSKRTSRRSVTRLTLDTCTKSHDFESNDRQFLSGFCDFDSVVCDFDSVVRDFESKFGDFESKTCVFVSNIRLENSAIGDKIFFIDVLITENCMKQETMKTKRTISEQRNDLVKTVEDASAGKIEKRVR